MREGGSGRGKAEGLEEASVCVCVSPQLWGVEEMNGYKNRHEMLG